MSRITTADESISVRILQPPLLPPSLHPPLPAQSPRSGHSEAFVPARFFGRRADRGHGGRRQARDEQTKRLPQLFCEEEILDE